MNKFRNNGTNGQNVNKIEFHVIVQVQCPSGPIPRSYLFTAKKKDYYLFMEAAHNNGIPMKRFNIRTHGKKKLWLLQYNERHL